MAFRAPRYSYVHAAREVGVAWITVSDTADADFPVDNLIDDRAGTIFKWSASVVNPTIDIDLGAGFDTGISRLIIPSNHNIEQITVQDDDAADFVGATTLHAADTSPVAGTLIDIEFDTGNSTQRYIRITITGTAQYSLSQIILTKIIFDSATAPGPNLVASPDGHKANASRLIQQTGLSPTTPHGAQQRVLDYLYESPLSGSDLTDMEAFIDSVGMSRPFYVDPASFSTPPETDEPALWMKFADKPRSQNSILVPMIAARSKTFELSLIESLD